RHDPDHGLRGRVGSAEEGVPAQQTGTGERPRNQTRAVRRPTAQRRVRQRACPPDSGRPGPPAARGTVPVTGSRTDDIAAAQPPSSGADTSTTRSVAVETPPPRHKGRVPYPAVLLVLTVLLLAAMLLGLAVGSVSLPLERVWYALLDQVVPGTDHSDTLGTAGAIVTEVRAPRVLLGGVVGAGLAVVGAALQALVRNPLADPYLLGISSGASLGAVLVLASGATILGMVVTPMLAAFLVAMATLALVYTLARTGGRMTTIRLVLAGVAVSYVLSALTDLLLTLSGDPQLLQSVRFWTLGSLAGAEWDGLVLPAGVV